MFLDVFPTSGPMYWYFWECLPVLSIFSPDNHESNVFFFSHCLCGWIYRKTLIEEKNLIVYTWKVFLYSVKFYMNVYTFKQRTKSMASYGLQDLSSTGRKFRLNPTEAYLFRWCFRTHHPWWGYLCRLLPLSYKTSYSFTSRRFLPKERVRRKQIVL